MFGERAEVCHVCGKAFLAGCVMGEPCPDCSAEERALIATGWKKTQEGFGARFGFGEEMWADPRFPGTTKTRKDAMAIQLGRDIENLKGGKA